MAVIAIFTYDVKPSRMGDFMANFGPPRTRSSVARLCPR
jgi:hypothetical protein